MLTLRGLEEARRERTRMIAGGDRPKQFCAVLPSTNFSSEVLAKHPSDPLVA